jgi:hypothetical protein
MLKKILLVVAVMLIGIQFFRPAKNLSSGTPGKDDIMVRFSPPPDVRHVLEVACYDCHSNNTRYPWYAEVQPTGWWVAGHIADGKHALNFSEFGAYTAKRQARKLTAITDQVSDHDMPLQSYTWIHRDARLTEAQIKAVSDWADALHDKVSPDDEK